MAGRLRSRALVYVVAAVVGLIGVLMLWAGPVQGMARVRTDTVNYSQLAYQFAGDDKTTASVKAVRFVCDDEVDYVRVQRDDCERGTSGVLGFPAQYQAIFEARPGLPALMSVFIRLFGDQGIYLTIVLLQIATGVLVVMAARAIGLPGLWPLAAEAAYFLLPSGYVCTRVLTEAASAPGLVALLYAAALMMRGSRPRAALGVFAGAFAWLFAVRAADATMAAACLLVAGVGAYAAGRLRRGSSGRAGWSVPLIITSGSGLVAMIVINTALSWPTVNQGITDIMTDHFTQRPTSDMYIRFLHAEFRFWRAFLPLIAGGAYLVVLAVLGLWGVTRRLRGWAAAPVLAVAGVGVTSLLIHPGDWARMLAPLWIVVALGLPLLVEPLVSGRRKSQPAVGELGFRGLIRSEAGQDQFGEAVRG